MAVVVTGASGFIGRHVVAACRAAGQDVLSIPHRWRDRAELSALLETEDVDRCIHLGWYAHPRDYLTNNAENLRSLQDSLDLVEVLVAAGCTKLVVSGTCAEYASSSDALREVNPVRPWSVYGATKACLHLLLKSSFCDAGLAVVWTRLFNLTGPGEDPSRLLPFVASKLRKGETVSLSPGVQRRDYLDVRDVASALVHLATVNVSGTYNICSGRPISLRTMLIELAEVCGAPSSLLRFGDRNYGPQESMFVVGDPSELRALGWDRRYTLTETLRSVGMPERPDGGVVLNEDLGAGGIRR